MTGFKEQHGCGCGDVEGFHGRPNGNADFFATGGQELGGDAGAFVAEDEEKGTLPIELAVTERGFAESGDGAKLVLAGGLENVCGRQPGKHGQTKK